MQVVHFGHAAVGLTARRAPSPGFKLLFDPYEPQGFGGAMGFSPIEFEPDVVLCTHAHLDHAHTAPFARAQRFPMERLQDGLVPGGEPWGLRALDVAHDPFDGALRGGRSWCLRVVLDGLRVVHLGDLGETPPQDRLDLLTGGEPVDLLLATCGGHYTMGPDQAAELALRLQARVVLPIHHQDPRCGLPGLHRAELLVRRFGRVLEVGERFELDPQGLPAWGTALRGSRA